MKKLYNIFILSALSASSLFTLPSFPIKTCLGLYGAYTISRSEVIQARGRNALYNVRQIGRDTAIICSAAAKIVTTDVLSLRDFFKRQKSSLEEIIYPADTAEQTDTTFPPVKHEKKDPQPDSEPVNPDGVSQDT